MDLIAGISGFIGTNLVSISITIGVIITYFVGKAVISKVIRRQAKRSDVAYERQVYVRKLLNNILTMVLLTVGGAAWEISLKGLSLYFASIFTVVGVGLFATWSVLSNLTASLILFFFFPYRIGHKVRIIDGDNSVEGTITDISLFYIKIESANKAIYSYPNNLAIQKPVVIL